MSNSGRTLLLATAMAMIAVAGWEAAWRLVGYGPARYDDMDLWARERRRLVTEDEKVPVALLGASRMQAALDLTAFRANVPGHEPVMLAIFGMFPVAAALDVLNDRGTRGMVVLDLDGRALAPAHHNGSAPYVRHYRQQYGPQRWIEVELRSWLQSRLVTAGAEFNLVTRIGAALVGHPLPAKNAFEFLPDRSMAIDYTAYDRRILNQFYPQLEEEYREQLRSDPTTWLDSLQPLIRAIRSYRARGGEVVLLRMPSSGRYLELDEQYFPRERYWDHLIRLSGARAIWFADWPELSGFDLADDSHIDTRQRRAFTEALIQVMRKIRVLPAA